MLCWFRHGKYEYVKGTTSVIEEHIKLVDVEDIEALTTTPMNYELAYVTH